MDKISEKKLKIMIKTIKKKFPSKDNDFYKMFLSTELLRLFIGNEWVNISIFNKNVGEYLKHIDARNFLRSSENGFQWQERVRRLAERIYNLQDIKNIGYIIEKIKQGEFSSRFAEIEGATHFYRCKIPFEFVNPIGEKGKDFDIRLLTSPTINCDIKHKLENFTREEKIMGKTIKKTLRKAILQVPKNEPSLFLVKIPEDWNKKFELINNSLNEFFNEKNSINVMGIILRWEERNKINEGIFYWKFNLFKNKNFKSNEEIDKTLDSLTKPSYENWVNFENIV
jgi:hypothetical protein